MTLKQLNILYSLDIPATRNEIKAYMDCYVSYRDILNLIKKGFVEKCGFKSGSTIYQLTERGRRLI